MDFERPFMFRTYDLPAHLEHETTVGRPITLGRTISLTDKNKQSSNKDFQIWQVARATSAATLYFPPLYVGDEFIYDGGFQGTNNPTLQALDEVMYIDRRTPKTSTAFVSIGSGHSPVTSRKQPSLFRIIKESIKLLTDPERTHSQMQHRAATHDFPYFRFSGPSLTTRFDEWRPSTVSDIESETKQYLGQSEVINKLQKCAEVLVVQWRSRM